jgi:hypothetical protein
MQPEGSIQCSQEPSTGPYPAGVTHLLITKYILKLAGICGETDRRPHFSLAIISVSVQLWT